MLLEAYSFSLCHSVTGALPLLQEVVSATCGWSRDEKKGGVRQSKWTTDREIMRQKKQTNEKDRRCEK